MYPVSERVARSVTGTNEITRYSVETLSSMVVVATVVATTMWFTTDLTGLSRAVTAGIAWTVAFASVAVGLRLFGS